MKLRWCLPPLAALSLAGLLWITVERAELSPQELLDAARARLESEPADPAGARRDLDEALRQAQAPEQAELRAALLDARSAVYADEGLLALALADCRARLEEWGASTDTLARAGELCLQLGEPGLALEYAEHLAALDPARGQSQIGRARVALADLPLAALERLAASTLLPSVSAQATTLAQRAAVFADVELSSSVPLEELQELFSGADERRRAGEWVREAAEHLRAARHAFVASLGPGSSGEVAAGLQDLLLRGGAEREAADLGLVALSIPDLANPMPVLARTASALVALGRDGTARALILDLKKRSPHALQPEDLPSLALRDELEEWCRLLETLELWEELRAAAKALCARTKAGDDQQKTELAWLISASAELHLGNFSGVQKALNAIGSSLRGQQDLALRVWLMRAELARRMGELAQERYALLLVTRSAPADPAPPLRAEVGRAWQRLAELHKNEGNLAAAEIGLTHALRCSSERATEVEPLWHEIGRKALATRAASSPYLLYVRAKNQEERGEAALALTDARALLQTYPGLGPALELLSRAAHRLRDYPLLIATSLELMERGWPSGGASGRLRSVPPEYFLPQDRVRWLLLDPRGSLEAVVRTLLAKGDVHGAALAARASPVQSHPPELLPLLARVALEDGEPAVALELLAPLPAEGALFRSSTGLALRAALELAHENGLSNDLTPLVAKVIASGQVEDRELLEALDALLASARTSEAAALLAWLAPQSSPFLGELLLRQTVARVLTQRSGPVDEDLERATALLEDGRTELGRLVLAFEHGDEAALAREARAALDTPLARTPERRAALALLAGQPAAAAELVAGRESAGRELLLDLVQGCLVNLAPDLLAARGTAPLPAPVSGAMPEERLLVFALAAETAPWNAWALARMQALDEPVGEDPWLRALQAQAWLTLPWPAMALTQLGPAPEGGEPDARLAWLRVRAARAAEPGQQALLVAELDWFRASGSSSSKEPELAPLEAALAARGGQRDEAIRILEAALEQRPGDSTLVLALAQLENTSGKRTRAIELIRRVLAGRPGRAGDEEALALLDVLRTARDEGEISEEHWWAEVEALEAERPEDPAPPRELSTRAFEGAESGAATGRVQALERLARLRARTLARPLETLRSGEGERWIQLLARHTPERAVAFAEKELRSDPSDPALWRASASALLAAGRPSQALERLEALQRVAPNPETARLLALTSFQIKNDPQRLVERLAAMKSFDKRIEDDAVLAFYSRLFAPRGKDRLDGLEQALELWKARGENGLGMPEHGRALALGLFYDGRLEPALSVLRETNQLARSALEKDLLEALGHLMRSAPAKPRRLADAPPPPVPDDAPGEKAGGKAGGKGAKAGAEKKPKAGAKNQPQTPRAHKPGAPKPK